MLSCSPFGQNCSASKKDSTLCFMTHVLTLLVIVLGTGGHE